MVQDPEPSNEWQRSHIGFTTEAHEHSDAQEAQGEPNQGSFPNKYRLTTPSDVG